MPGINRFLLYPTNPRFVKKLYPKGPVIYKIVNIINDKIYIGQTINFADRKKYHYHSLIKKRHSSYHLQNSFNKYGIDSFYIEIIEFCTIEIINKREEYWIKRYQTYNRKYGYNLNAKNIPFYGKRTPEQCLNISKSLIGNYPSKETRKKQSESRIGRFMGSESPVAKPIIQYDKSMNKINEFHSLNEASKKLNKNSETIGCAARGIRKTAYGFIWKYKKIA